MRVLALLLLMAYSSAALADGKVEEIIDAMGVKDGINGALEIFKPNEIKIDANDTSDANAILLRHQKEYRALFERYFSWDNLMPEMVVAFESIYAKEDIEAIHRFLKSRHGAKFLKGMGELDNAYSRVVNAIVQEYQPEFKALSDRHSQEIDQLIEKESVKQDSLPKPEVDPNAPTTIGDIVRFSVAYQNGQMIGYKARPGRKGGFFEKSGFHKNDIIVSMNGLLVNDPKAVRDIYRMLKESRIVLFEVERGGELVDFVVDLDEIENQE